MFQNLTGKQILLIIIVIIVILWLIYYFVNRSAMSTEYMTNQQIPQGGCNQPSQAMKQKIHAMAQSQMAQKDCKQEVPFTLYNFYSPDCGWCKKFMPVWDELANGLQGIGALAIKKVDVTKPENENLAFYYNVSAYPTIILVTPNRNMEYTGDRTAKDLGNFVLKHINEYYSNN